jgi:hypothetical protein
MGVSTVRIRLCRSAESRRLKVRYCPQRNNATGIGLNLQLYNFATAEKSGLGPIF